MAKGSQSHDGKGGRFVLIPHAVLESPAYRMASLRAKVVLLMLCKRFNGFNNGKIVLSLREITHELGNQNFNAASAALGELVAHGLIELASEYSRGSRLAR